LVEQNKRKNMYVNKKVRQLGIPLTKKLSMPDKFVWQSTKTFFHNRLFSPDKCRENETKTCAVILSRVARWFVFTPKVPIWVNFGGPWNGKCQHVLRPFGIFYGLLV
jgi:hypothetical protein